MTRIHGGVATALESHHRYLRWLVPTLEKFPRSQKFLLGDRIQTLGLDILESLVDATFSRERASSLRQANVNIEKTRHLLRLCCDLDYLDRRRHEHAIRLLHETGSRIGAWQKLNTGRDVQAADAT